MTRALTRSIAQVRPVSQSELNRTLRRFLSRKLPSLAVELRRIADEFCTERYRKHFDSLAHACLLLFHGLSGRPSLQQSYAAFASCPLLAHLSGLLTSADPEGDRLGVSFSQFALSNSTRPSVFLGALIPTLIEQVRSLQSVCEYIPRELLIMDSTFVRLSLALAPWLPNKGGADVAKMRIQVQYTPRLDLPEVVNVTDTKTSDHKGLEEIIANPSLLAKLAGCTLILDLGFYSHRRFAQLLASGIHLVTRLHPQASLRVVSNLPLQPLLPNFSPPRIQVESDQVVEVGSEKSSVVIRGMRLVRALVLPSKKARGKRADPVLYQVLTDRFDLDALQVVQIYLWRWQIELFFRWLKSHLHLPRLLGYSRNAVELTVYLAIIVHILTLLASDALGFRRRSPILLSRVASVLTLLVDSAGKLTQFPPES